MQTFLPEPDFRLSAERLDTLRLGKQIIEAGQIVRALYDPDYGWQSHPAVNMWRGHEASLMSYLRAVTKEWDKRRPKPHQSYWNTMIWLDERDFLPILATGTPPWLGDKVFHTSHQSNLMRKDASHYGKWYSHVPSWLEYFWPV